MAAELAHQIDGGAPDRGVRRALEAFDRPLPGGAERQQDRREPLARSRALFGGQGLGERPDQHLAERHARCLHPLELLLVDRRQVRGDVTHHRAGDQQVDRGRGVLSPCRRCAAARFAHKHVNQRGRGFEVADQQQVVEQADHRDHHLAPAVVVALDAQNVDEQRQIQGAQRSGGDAAYPGGDALGRIVADLFDRDGLRPHARKLAPVFL